MDLDRTSAAVDPAQLLLWKSVRVLPTATENTFIQQERKELNTASIHLSSPSTERSLPSRFHILPSPDLPDAPRSFDTGSLDLGITRVCELCEPICSLTLKPRLRNSTRSTARHKWTAHLAVAISTRSTKAKATVPRSKIKMTTSVFDRPLPGKLSCPRSRSCRAPKEDRR